MLILPSIWILQLQFLELILLVAKSVVSCPIIMLAFELLTQSIADGMLFYILVTIEYAERSASTRGTAKGRKHTESKNTVDQVAIFGSSRTQFITAALAAHNLQNVYVPGPMSGPGFKIHWSGSRYFMIIPFMVITN